MESTAKLGTARYYKKYTVCTIQSTNSYHNMVVINKLSREKTLTNFAVKVFPQIFFGCHMPYLPIRLD